MALTLARAACYPSARLFIFVPRRLLSTVSTFLTQSPPLPTLFLTRRSLPPLSHAVQSFTSVPPSTCFVPVRCLVNRSGNLAYSPLNSSSNFTARPPTDPYPDYEHWFVIFEKRWVPDSKEQMIDCYIETLAKVVGSEEEAKKRIYIVSRKPNFGFGCQIDKETANKLEALPGVDSVIADFYNGDPTGYGDELFVNGKVIQNSPPELEPKQLFIHMDRPREEGATKQQMIDYFIQTLAKVVGSEEEATERIYRVSCKAVFGFGCEIDEDIAKKLNGLPGVLSLLPDPDHVFGCEDDGGEIFVNGEIIPVRIKKDFVRGIQSISRIPEAGEVNWKRTESYVEIA